jgi:environmental stress-induced protein Ves
VNPPRWVVIVRAAEQPVVPWRNGGGTTREVAIDPPGATVAGGFCWRVSRAQVASDGPFSRFPGLDRSLWLLRGSGMELDVDGRRVVLDRRLQRFDFAGEAVVAARLLGGPNEDLNVFWDRGRVAAHAELLVLPAGAACERELPAGQHVVLVLDGALAATATAPSLATGDALRCDGAGRLELRATAAATLLLASFVPR